MFDDGMLENNIQSRQESSYQLPGGNETRVPAGREVHFRYQDARELYQGS